jgi:hypothetical protein
MTHLRRAETSFYRLTSSLDRPNGVGADCRRSAAVAGTCLCTALVDPRGAVVLTGLNEDRDR